MAQPMIIDQEMGIHSSVTKGWSSLESPTMSASAKFECNLVSSLSANEKKLLDQSEARKQHWEFSEASSQKLI